MRKTVIALVALGLVVASSAFAANAVRISQVYGGGGGGTTNTYKYDYVELFNSSSAAVNIGGWALQYGSATGTTFGSSTYNYAIIPTGATIPACGYYLIRCGSAGSGGADLPVTPDYLSATINVQAQNAKFVLTTTQTFNQTCAYWLGPPTGAGYVDLVGFGTATCYETTVAPTLNGAAVLVRGLGGLTDTDVNSADFTVISHPYAMHNSTMTNPDCVIVPATSETWGRIKTIYR